MAPISCDNLNQRDRRSLVFHLLYAADAFDYDVSTESLIERFAHGYDCVIDRNAQVFHMANEVIENRLVLDQQILPLLENWKFDRLSVATRLILRYAIWEFTCTDTPSMVVINEAVELAQCFAEKDAYRFVNGLLDEWRKRNRPEEVIEVVIETPAE
jgi:N utilization substance protein B